MDISYFDNAATTFPKPEVVYATMDTFYRTCGVNVGRGQHKLAFTASSIVDETRKQLLNLFKANNKKVVFTPSATEALNLVLRGISLSKNSHVYVTPLEHNAVTRVLHYLGCQVHLLDIDTVTLQYDFNQIEKQFQLATPSAIVMSHASNVCGLVAPIEELCQLAKKYSAVTIIDMSQTAGLIDANLSSNIYDFAIFAGHKTLYGPFGIAGLIFNPSNKLEPLIYGGTGVDSANQDMPESLPERLEAGSPNILAISGLHAALNWIEETGIQNIYKKEQENCEKLLALLGNYRNVRILANNTNTERIGVISCVFENYSADSIGNILSNMNIAVRTGLHCSPYAHKFLGTFPSGTVRFSVSYFNHDNDFARLKDALDYIEING